MMLIFINKLETCNETKRVLGCCNNPNIRFDDSFCLVLIKLMSLADNVKNADSAPEIIKDNTNKTNKMSKTVVITAGGICACNKTEVQYIMLNNAIFSNKTAVLILK